MATRLAGGVGAWMVLLQEVRQGTVRKPRQRRDGDRRDTSHVVFRHPDGAFSPIVISSETLVRVPSAPGHL